MSRSDPAPLPTTSSAEDGPAGGAGAGDAGCERVGVAVRRSGAGVGASGTSCLVCCVMAAAGGPHLGDVAWLPLLKGVLRPAGEPGACAVGWCRYHIHCRG